LTNKLEMFTVQLFIFLS